MLNQIDGCPANAMMRGLQAGNNGKHTTPLLQLAAH
jgi:hypothetical protein